jgi:hypothetical protein
LLNIRENNQYNNFELLSAKNLLLKQKSLLQSQYQPLRAEVEVLEGLIENFLSDYFDFVFKKLEKKDFKIIPKFFANIDSLTPEIFEIKRNSISDESKKVFKKIVKLTHPDYTGSNILEDYLLAQELLAKQDINGLYYLYNKLQSEKEIAINEVLEIENIEKEILNLSYLLSEAKLRLEEILASAEYKLFIRYKILTANGFDFFAEVEKIFTTI